MFILNIFEISVEPSSQREDSATSPCSFYDTVSLHVEQKDLPPLGEPAYAVFSEDLGRDFLDVYFPDPSFRFHDPKLQKSQDLKRERESFSPKPEDGHAHEGAHERAHENICRFPLFRNKLPLLDFTVPLPQFLHFCASNDGVREYEKVIPIQKEERKSI